MAHADEKSVLGDFNDVRFEHMGVLSRFHRSGSKYFVETDGPTGALSTFEIKYTFGLEPLQQYLIEFPDGRVQALSIAWDSRPKQSGGQRWFHLYPNEKIEHSDSLHWTKLNQNWNFMCAECHSTGVRKNYDSNTNTFRTTFSEISVGCEACHGQGSRHVAWAKNQNSWWPTRDNQDPSFGLLVRYAERLNVDWPIDPKTGSARRSTAPASLRSEVETCGYCHARRGPISEDWKPGRSLSQTHNVSPLTRGLFHADGQMLDEVYNYASFKQSKMFAAGVTCSDCHDPHSGKPRAGGDSLCLQCHSSEKFAAPSHHRHADLATPLTCASCHMPVRTYMIVDPRHDHSFRIPRPDISVSADTPNACNDCHKDRTAQWAAKAIETWHGTERKGLQTYGEAFHAAWADRVDAARQLAAVAGSSSLPGIVRASAFSELSSRMTPALMTPALMTLVRSGLANADPMMRIGVLDMLERLPAAQVWPVVSPLLTDPVAGVRLRAVQLLAGAPTSQLSAAERQRFQWAADEYIAAQRHNADRPDARTALGNFFARTGHMHEAEIELTVALRLSPSFAPAAVNLADLYRQSGRDHDGEKTLREALRAAPRDASLHHALGLALVRLKRLDDAIGALTQAVEIEPRDARYRYVLAVALSSAGRKVEAEAALTQNLLAHPADRPTHMAMISFALQAADHAAALTRAQAAAQIFPDDKQLASLIQSLQQRRGDELDFQGQK